MMLQNGSLQESDSLQKFILYVCLEATQDIVEISTANRGYILLGDSKCLVGKACGFDEDSLHVSQPPWLSPMPFAASPKSIKITINGLYNPLRYGWRTSNLWAIYGCDDHRVSPLFPRSSRTCTHQVWGQNAKISHSASPSAVILAIRIHKSTSYEW